MLAIYAILTQTFFKLPPTSSKIVDMVLVDGKSADNNNNKNRRDIYKVVAVGRYSANGINQKIVEIYDSSVKSWRTVGNFPYYLDLISEVVFFDGYFYCWTMHIDDDIDGLLVFCIEDGRGEIRMWNFQLRRLFWIMT